ncbi:MAG: tRNA 2-thiouridine(34) synthase MnmA [Planctomycetota bacterium]
MKVLVAMSGGVDSSVAAALVREAGHEAVGVFMRLGSPDEKLDEPVEVCDLPAASTKGTHKQGCCSVGDAADARQVAAELGIPLYVCNFRNDFRRIIDYFVEEYATGRTPNPCVRCNDWLKFGKLHGYAKRLGCDAVASGHYARVGEVDGDRVMLRGADAGKDQSYVLFGVPRGQLGEMMLPIGEYETKQEVRDLAQRFGLPTFDKPDSQEICFVPGQDYVGFIERERPGLVSSGAILTRDGTPVGEHRGQHRFTIGQRRGLGLSQVGDDGGPVYVVQKDPATNAVIVGSGDDLLARSLVAAEANWLVDAWDGWREVLVQHRYNSAAVPGRTRIVGDVDVPNHSGRSGAFEVVFDEAQRAVTGGQAVVLFEGERVLGGGWIARVGAGG